MNEDGIKAILSVIILHLTLSDANLNFFITRHIITTFIFLLVSRKYFTNISI